MVRVPISRASVAPDITGGSIQHTAGGEVAFRVESADHLTLVDAVYVFMVYGLWFMVYGLGFMV